eukprot:TRINITY_DN8250_c1_g3_i1.p1 TRINITY_DN8250_c1_g3~~TRINITY_DN8250_c1_g3_i1.p1  ORF type:complete len:489 (-),score=91.07 TRINITY_DN8250_c1_g3_i1:667-2109(-)
MLKFVFILNCILSTVGQLSQQSSKQVAIIGGGIGGACTAHFIKNLTQNQVEIQVFEQSDRIGGRIWSFEYEGKKFELGAAIIHKENKYVVDLAKEMGLNLKGVGDSSLLGIFDGKEFVFLESKYSFVNYFNLIRRYGFAPLIFRPLLTKMLNRFVQIYQIQANWTSFDSPVDLLEAQELYNFTQYSFREVYNEYMNHPRYKAKTYLEEVLGAVTRVNYNQNNNLTALVGLVSNSAASSDVLVHIEGGNQQLPEKLLRNTKVQLNSQVKQIIQTSDGKFEISLNEEEEEAANNLGPFDAVVISTPLALTKINIQLSNGKKLPSIPQMAYRHCVSTYVKGFLKSVAFGIEGEIPVDDIFVTEKAETFYQSISFKMKMSDNSSVYKIFTTNPMTKDQLEFLFDEGEVIKVEDWLAYPQYIPPEKFSPFVLTPGLVYGSAFEGAASAMEISAVSAKNSALLIAKYLGFEFQQESLTKKEKSEEL